MEIRSNGGEGRGGREGGREGGLYLSDNVLHEPVNGEDDISMHTKHLPTGVLVRDSIDIA